VGPEIIAGAIAWRADFAGEVLEMFRSLSAQAPPELTCVAALRMAPPAPWLPKDVHGEPIVALFVCCTANVSDGEKLVAPIKAFGSPVGDIVQRRTYVSQQSLIDAPSRKVVATTGNPITCPTLSWSYSRWRVSTPKLSPRPIQRSCCFRLTERSTGSPMITPPSASWEKAEDDKTNIDWARAAWRDLRSFSTGGTYVNFLTEEEGDDRIHAAYGNNYERLVDVKSKWDPSNLFRMNKNIIPRV
jgi:hypothetical protein